MAPEHAFDRLYRRHSRDVYRFAYGLVRNRADAEDVAQTAFLNAYRALARGHRPESPRNWLLAIAQNVARQRFRQQQRRPQEVALDVELAEAIAVEEDSSLAPEDISRALNHLAPNQRAALVLREIEGQTYAEIAEALGLKVSAVETLIFRARRALREQLEESLTCAQARQLIEDGGRSRRLRAHLRECADCSTLARRARARRSALRSLFGLPWFGSGSAAVATKVAAVVLATGIAGGLTELLAPPAHAHHARRAGKAMPIAAALAMPRAHVARVRPAVAKAEPAAKRADKRAAAPIAAAPIHAHARPDEGTTQLRETPPPAAPPVTTAASPAPAPAPPAAAAPAHPDATGPITAATSGSTTTVTVATPAVPAAPTVTVTVTAPSLPAPPPLPSGLTQISQN